MGSYEIVRLLAKGGMATLHVAREATSRSALRRYVALKRMLPQLAGDPELRQLFVAEARIAATLQHPHIVRVLTVSTDGPEPWFAMEYLHGEDLRRILETLSFQLRTLPRAHAVAIVRAACAGLEHAHARGIVHRDVSPQNLLLTYAGEVKLVDFGIARVVGRLREREHRGGKVQYMSPEQLRAEEVDRRSDVFSLAVVLWELTVGKRLFRGVSDEVIEKMILEEEPPPPSRLQSDYPPALEAIVMRGLERDPAARWPTALAMGQALAAWAETAGELAPPEELARFVDDLFASAQPLPAGAEDTMETPLEMAPPPLPDEPENELPAPSLSTTARLPRPRPYEAPSVTGEVRAYRAPRRSALPYVAAAALAALVATCAIVLHARHTAELAARAAARGIGGGAPFPPDLGP